MLPFAIPVAAELKSRMSATMPLSKSCMHSVNLGTASIHELCHESMRHSNSSIEIVNNASNKHFLSGLLLEVLESLEASISTHNPQFTHKLNYDQWCDVIWKAFFGQKPVFQTRHALTLMRAMQELVTNFMMGKQEAPNNNSLGQMLPCIPCIRATRRVKLAYTTDHCLNKLQLLGSQWPLRC